jgi:general secretion pathway protein I
MNSRGFTLMEILVALAIFGILATAFLSQSSRQLAGASQAELQLAGDILAENELNRVLARKQWTEPGLISYPISYGAHEFEIIVDTRATDFPLLRRVEVAVLADTLQPHTELARLVGFRGQH